VPPEHRFEENKVESVIDNTGHINHITNENDNFNSSYIPECYYLW
jgi:hypothetical protein